MSASTPNEPAVTPAEPVWSIWTALAFLVLWGALMVLIQTFSVVIAALLRAPDWSNAEVLETYINDYVRSVADRPEAAIGVVACTLLAWLVVFGILQMMFQKYPPGSFAKALGMQPPTRRWALAVAVPVALVLLFVGEVIIVNFGTEEDKTLEQLMRSMTGRVAIGLHAAFLAPFFEEIFFRGFMWAPLARRMPLVSAVLLNGLIFSVVHAGSYGLDPAYLIPLWAMGAGMAGLRAWSGSVWVPMLAHFVYNGTSLVVFFLTEPLPAPT